MNIEVATSPNKQDLETKSKGILPYNQKYISDDVVFEPNTKFTVFAKEKGFGYMRTETFSLQTNHFKINAATKFLVN